MSREQSREDMIARQVVYRSPLSEAVTLRREVACGPGLLLDIYKPSGRSGPLPAVVIAAGYPDAGFERMMGCRFKDLGSSVSWARLIAAECACAAVTYCNQQRPAEDCAAVLAWLQSAAAEAEGIDPDRLGVWASSGNVPVALSILMDRPEVRCGALLYGFTLGPAVDEAAKQFRFANPVEGRTIADLRSDLPLFVARAGQDAFAGLNESMDAFVAQCLQRNQPLTVMNYAAAPHAFDLLLDTAESRDVVRSVLGFLRLHMGRDAVMTPALCEMD